MGAAALIAEATAPFTPRDTAPAPSPPITAPAPSPPITPRPPRHSVSVTSIAPARRAPLRRTVSAGAAALIAAATLSAVSGEDAADYSATETEDDIDSQQDQAGFDAAAYIEAACQDYIFAGSSCDEADGDSDDLGLEPRTSMSDGAKALIDSLLVFSEDGMDELANHIESNRDDDQLAEEEIEHFIGNLADEAMTTFAERLETP